MITTLFYTRINPPSSVAPTGASTFISSHTYIHNIHSSSIARGYILPLELVDQRRHFYDYCTNIIISCDSREIQSISRSTDILLCCFRYRQATRTGRLTDRQTLQTPGYLRWYFSESIFSSFLLPAFDYAAGGDLVCGAVPPVPPPYTCTQLKWLPAIAY